MKIYRLSQFQMIPQNPTGAVNPDAQLQNLQNSQQAVTFLQNVIEATNQVTAALANLNDALGTDAISKSDIEGRINQAIMQTPAFDLLSKMGMVSDVGFLTDPNKVSQLQVNIQRQVQNYSSGMTGQI